MAFPTDPPRSVPFRTKRLASTADETAPDGSEVRVLLALEGGSMAHFKLAASEVSKAVAHKTVDEVWFILSGWGEMWRRKGDQEEVTSIESGISLTLPCGTHFQFRSLGDAPLTAIGATFPPWPGLDEATVVEGRWKSTVPCPP
jgi:mannose-6-phosphate isomerase-like protein (cupin superfamily)